MPTITFSLKDLVGKKLSIEEVETYAHYGKGDLESYTQETDEIKIDFGDTNLPYLWSVEGFARLVRLILGKQKGIPVLQVNKSDYTIQVDSSVLKVRPFIDAFVAKGRSVDDYMIKQIVQLQEKLCDNYGRRRQKVAIGVYQCHKINFPVHYTATSPESVKFTPLDFKKEMTQQEILEDHPKGKEFSWILEGHTKYPLLLDHEHTVLSFPPIINSEETGRVKEGDSELFIEVTGIDDGAVHLAANIMAQALFERGFSIYEVVIAYPTKEIHTPLLFNDTIKMDSNQVRSVLGLELSSAETKKLLAKAGYNLKGDTVIIPPYRKDILHFVDVIEDIAIMYDYNKIPTKPLENYTIGSTFPLIKIIDRCRELLIGLGYQEMMSPILTNVHTMNRKMIREDSKTLEILNYMSETYSAVRSWLIPLLLDTLSKNKHRDYPQKIFEQGLISLKNKGGIADQERLAVITIHETANYTEMRQLLDYIMKMLKLEYTIEELEHPSFIRGRSGKVIVKDKEVALLGEIHPQVIRNFNLELPAVACELNISELSKELI